MKKTDNNMIYIWRIVFTMLVAWFHFDNVYSITSSLGFSNGWYISVEFFFIVSGFLMYFQVKNKEKYSSNFEYTIDRFYHIYPTYFCCFMITFAFKAKGDWNNRVLYFFESFWELLALQSVGLNKGWDNVNPTAWYISSLFICSFFLFFLLKNYEKLTTNFGVPLGIMVIYSWFYRSKGCLDFVVEMDAFYMNAALLRGIADMGLGVLAAKLYIYLKKRIKNVWGWKMGSFIGFLFVILCSFVRGYSNLDFIMAIVLMFSISIAFLPNEKIGIPLLVKFWSRASLGIYLIHEVVRTYIFPQIFGIPEELSKKVMLSILYLIVITLMGFLLTLISDYIRKFIEYVKFFILG